MAQISSKESTLCVPPPMACHSRRAHFGLPGQQVTKDKAEYRIAGRSCPSTVIPWKKSPTSWLQWHFRFCGIHRVSHTSEQWRMAHGKVSQSISPEYVEYAGLTDDLLIACSRTKSRETVDGITFQDLVITQTTLSNVLLLRSTGHL